MIALHIHQALEQAVHTYDPSWNGSIMIDHPAHEQHGDYTSAVALSIAKQRQQSPLLVAQEIVDRLNTNTDFVSAVSQIVVAPPGFINITLKSTTLMQELGRYASVPQHHPEQPGKGQRVMVEYSSPNIAKPFNVGHLRSTIIGETIARLHQYMGYEVLRDNHLGDWGTQYGKLAYAVDHWGDWTKIEADPIPELFRLYVRFHQEEKENADLQQKGREYFRRLENGDSHVRKTWEKLVKLSLQDFNQLYQQLGVHFDMMLGESYYEPMLTEVIDESLQRGVARESEGALLIFFDDPDLQPHPLMIRKNDGTSTYGTRDLAGIKYRLPKFSLDRLIIEIGNEQQLYFQQVIRAAEMLGYAKPGQLAHVGHGLFLLPTGKMSTRRGETVWLKDLIAELTERAREIVSQKSPQLDSKVKDAIADAVAIGALKYNDLSQNRQGNVVFDKEKSLSLTGNSAPYLQYTIARARSVLRQSEAESITSIDAEQVAGWDISPTEMSLLRWVARFDEAAAEAQQAALPNILATYLFQTAQRFNTYYQQVPIIQSSEPTRTNRLFVTQATANVLEAGLNLLGIEVPQRM